MREALKKPLHKHYVSGITINSNNLDSTSYVHTDDYASASMISFKPRAINQTGLLPFLPEQASQRASVDDMSRRRKTTHDVSVLH